MENKRKFNGITGISWLSLLGLVFLALKVSGNVPWPWWVVLAPFYVPYALTIIILILVAIVLKILNNIKE